MYRFRFRSGEPVRSAVRIAGSAGRASGPRSGRVRAAARTSRESGDASDAIRALSASGSFQPASGAPAASMRTGGTASRNVCVSARRTGAEPSPETRTPIAPHQRTAGSTSFNHSILASSATGRPTASAVSRMRPNGYMISSAASTVGVPRPDRCAARHSGMKPRSRMERRCARNASRIRVRTGRWSGSSARLRTCHGSA